MSSYNIKSIISKMPCLSLYHQWSLRLIIKKVMGASL